MKLVVLLLIFTTISAASIEEEKLIKRGAAQLRRLSGFRRTQEQNESHLQILPSTKEVLENNKVTSGHSTVNNEKTIEVDKIVKNEQSQNNENISKVNNEKILVNVDAIKRIDELANTAYRLFHDPQYEAMVRERIKRSGSGDFISGIAGKVINGVVGTASGLSSGLSGGSSGGGGGHTYDSYGVPVPAYEEKPFSIWDFKKAILNTLIQALKALAGGAIAFKGHLIKGGGFLVQTTGRVISSAGDATSSLGTQLASSAIIHAPKPVYGSPGYSYNSPHSQEYSYDGPPPSADAGYSEDDYSSHHQASDDNKDDKESGLLVIKPMKDVDVHHHVHHFHVDTPDSDHHNSNGPSEHPQSVSTPVDNHLSHPQVSNVITKVVGLITGASIPVQPHQDDGHIEYLPAEHKNQPIPQHHHDSPPLTPQHMPNQPTLSNYNKHNYQQTELHISPSSENNNLQQFTHNQLGYEDIQALINPHLGPPINPAQSFKDPELSYGVDGPLEPLKIPILDHHNTLDAGLPIGYGVPLNYGFDAAANYGNWKRSLMLTRSRRKNFKRSPSRLGVYRNYYPMLYVNQ